MFRWICAHRALVKFPLARGEARPASRTDPSHGAGGSDILKWCRLISAALLLAISILVSASFADELYTGKKLFDVIYPPLAFTFIMELAMVLLPPCVFAFKLRACQEKGSRDYTVFAARYALAPMAPLFLSKYPVAEIAQGLFNKLAGL